MRNKCVQVARRSHLFSSASHPGREPVLPIVPAGLGHFSKSLQGTVEQGLHHGTQEERDKKRLNEVFLQLHPLNVASNRLPLWATPSLPTTTHPPHTDRDNLKTPQDFLLVCFQTTALLPFDI